jgi:hypothetical protein
MSYVIKYLFIPAGDKREAVEEIDSRLNDWLGKEFYDGYEIVQSETKPVSEIPAGYFDKELCRTEDVLQSKRDEAERERRQGFREDEGHALRTVSDILCESFCQEMPWFNVDMWDWRVPYNHACDVVSLGDNETWWAVMVKFYL